MKTRQYFDAKWTVLNIGLKTWDIHAVDVRLISYRGGATMHTAGELFDLPVQTAPNRKITILVDMTTPKNPGYYDETWGLFEGGTLFCQFSMDISVTK